MATIKQTIIELFNLENMSPEKVAEIVDRLGKLIFQAVLVRALPLLSEKDAREYDKIIAKQEGGEVMFKFLSEKVPDFEKMITEEVKVLKAELAGEFKEAGI